MSSTLGTAAMLDSVGRFVGNVGVPAAIAFLVLWQITGRLDQMTTLQQASNTQLAVLAITCGQQRAPVAVPPLVYARPAAR